MDHEERIQEQVERIDQITTALADLPHLQLEREWNPVREAWIQLQIRVEGADNSRLQAICQELKAGDPSIWLRPTPAGDQIAVMVNTLQPGETEVVAQRLREVLAA